MKPILGLGNETWPTKGLIIKYWINPRKIFFFINCLHRRILNTKGTVKNEKTKISGSDVQHTSIFANFKIKPTPNC